MSFDKVIFTLSGQEFTLGQLLIVPATLIIGYLLINWLARLITNRMAARNLQPDLVHLIRRVFYVVALAVLVITLLDLINVPLTAFAFVSGAVAIGVGFGAQNIINNFISGWILMWERPIRIGDFLEVGADGLGLHGQHAQPVGAAGRAAFGAGEVGRPPLDHGGHRRVDLGHRGVVLGQRGQKARRCSTSWS